MIPATPMVQAGVWQRHAPMYAAAHKPAPLTASVHSVPQLLLPQQTFCVPPETSAADKVGRMFSVMGKDGTKDGEYLTVRDILQNVEAVKAFAPELLSEFPKIDQAGRGKITARQLEEYMSPSQSKERNRADLQRIWDRLASGRDEDLPADKIFLQDMARHYDFVTAELPDLIDLFHVVDTDHSCSIERLEFDAFFGNGEAWLEAKLASIIGLEELKEQIRTFYWSTRLDRMRRKGGLFVSNEESHVLMFKGNPGVGKTTVARLITGLLYKIGVIPSETFVEVQRDQLVGDHIGATEKATEEAIAKARGGVLFVDEAYRLSVDVFGVEAINCLMRAMTEKGAVIILAGYPKQMDEFISVNPGIKRRVTYEFGFPDYNEQDLASILRHQVKKRGFEIDTDVTNDQIATIIARHTTAGQRRTLNGGVGEHACRHAVFNLNKRQIDLVREAPDRSQQLAPSTLLQLEDIEYGCTQVPAMSVVTELKMSAPARDLSKSASPCSFASRSRPASRDFRPASQEFQDWLFSTSTSQSMPMTSLRAGSQAFELAGM